MELRQLRYFVAVAEEHHFGRAARRLHIAAPSLSAQIKVLEKDLHVVLLERGPHGVTLTRPGEVLLEHARVLLARSTRARDEVRVVGSAHRDKLTLQLSGGAEHGLRRVLQALPTRAPRLDVTITRSIGKDAIAAVWEGHADAAVVWDRVGDEPDLAVLTLQKVPMCLALPSGHRLADRTRIPVEELAEETIVLFPRPLGRGLWDRIVGHALPAGVSRPDQLRIQPHVMDAPRGMLEAVAAGYGLAPFAPQLVDDGLPDGVVTRPLVPELMLPLELIWREPAEPALRELITLLADSPD